MSDDSESESLPATERLDQIAKLLRDGKASPEVTVREFLRWFGVMRRGYYIVKNIRSTLRRSGLVTDPDFESTFIDGPMTFTLKSPQSETKPTTAEAGAPPGADASPGQATVSIGIADPTYRISKLAAANRPPTRVAPDAPLKTAVSLMLMHDYSQLPVMTNERSLKGMISWRSIGARWALDREGSAVREFMDDAYEINADRSLFSAIPIIVENDYVLVRDGTGVINGIVTGTDLSMQFQQLAEPFLLLGEIENHVRRLLDGKFTEPELQAAKDPGDSDRVVKNVSDLTFGEYLRLLQQPSSWDKIKVPLDRAIFTHDLDSVRTIRNDVMHFDPDGVPPEDLATLRRVAQFLQRLQGLGL